VAELTPQRLDEIEKCCSDHDDVRAAIQQALDDQAPNWAIQQLDDDADARARLIAEQLAPELVAEVRRLRAKAERDRAQLVAAQTDLLETRGHLSPNGQPRRVPVDISGSVAPAVAWLLAEVDRLNAENAAVVGALECAVTGYRAIEQVYRQQLADAADALTSCADGLSDVHNEDAADAAYAHAQQIRDRLTATAPEPVPGS
jgi:hypothetical protein